MSRNFVGSANVHRFAYDVLASGNAATLSPAATSFGKRFFDVAASAILLLFLLPMLLIVALLVKAESPGPILFKQRRTGLGGKTFMIYKFRTMNCCEDGPQITQATAGDHRVTRVGRLLRKTSIDELPQLFNILAGDMSLVGPRPHALAHDNFYGSEIPGYHRRFAVRPGITGLAQVRGLRGETQTVGCMAARVGSDLDYVNNWSLLTDVGILAKSALVVFKGSGA
jgi:putative colanic acid biosynthesis UDP-glucose lipid carrier transferase